MNSNEKDSERRRMLWAMLSVACLILSFHHVRERRTLIFRSKPMHVSETKEMKKRKRRRTKR